MKKKFIWLIVSVLMVAALVLASCAPAVVEEKEAKVVTKEPEKKVEKVEEVVEPETKYGGTITVAYDQIHVSWDHEDVHPNTLKFGSFMYDSLIIADWWADPDREVISFTSPLDCSWNQQLWIGHLVESWDWSDPLTMTFTLRKGVRWHNKPPANGREFVADDVVWQVERRQANPKRVNELLVKNIESVSAPDKYTVVFTFKEPNVMMLDEIGMKMQFVCPDVVAQYGDTRDWRTLVGTGPWIIDDVVADAWVNYKRNPDYHEKDLEGNQLPYADAIRLHTITDMATIIASLRTGKLDMTHWAAAVPWNYLDSMKATNPEMQFEPISGVLAFTIYLKTTKEPTSNLKVRQALAMAVNLKEMNDVLLGGTGNWFSWPAHPSWPSYTPVEELPANIREIYEWTPENVEKAKQLLAEAGYPNGFDISIQYNVSASMAPMSQGMEMIKDYWSKINVTLDLRPVDAPTGGYLRNPPFAYDDILGVGGGLDSELKVIEGKFRTGGPWNRAIVSDPILDEVFDAAMKEFDTAKRTALLKECYQRIEEQCYSIGPPVINSYATWHPWVKGWRGEAAVIDPGIGHAVSHIWLDLDLKEEMTGRR